MEIFVNSAIQNGIINYLNFINNKEINKIHIFEFWVIRVLVCIYGEINIINPYKLSKANSFKNNLLIFGLKEHEVNLFIKYMEEYDKWLNGPAGIKKTNIFNKISTLLINMLLIKSIKHNISSKDIELFNSFFDPEDKDLLKIKELMVEDKSLIPKLWKRKKGQFTEKLIFKEILPDLLEPSDYKRYGLSINEVKQLSNLKIKEINDKIINEERESSEGGRENFDPKRLILTSGSGFVDTIVLLSIMVTEIMVGLLIAFWFLRR